jgi:predicted nuclease of predicted toxin-antitoxin system
LLPLRLLLDECVPARLRKALASHQVSTVPEEGWSGVKNGKLLMLAAVKFDALITVDKNLPYQQNTVSLPISVFVLDAPSNELPYLLPLVPKLEVALASHEPGDYVLLRS